MDYVKRWKGETGKLISGYKGETAPVFDVVFSHDKKRFASCSWDGTIFMSECGIGRNIE